MTTAENSLKVPDHLTERISRSRSLFEGAYLQLTASYRNDNWGLSMGKLTFSDQRHEEIDYSYHGFKYMAQWISVDQAVNFISELIIKPGFPR